MMKKLNRLIDDLLGRINFKRKCPHVSLFTIFRIYTTLMIRPHDAKMDRIVKKVIDNYDHITKIESNPSHCTLEIYFDNGNSIYLWVTNLWYSFLTRTTFRRKDRRIAEEYNECRPSRKTMIEFLEKFHNHIVKMGDSLVVVDSLNDDVDDFFTFKNEKEKEDGQDNG